MIVYKIGVLGLTDGVRQTKVDLDIRQKRNLSKKTERAKYSDMCYELPNGKEIKRKDNKDFF